MKTTIMILLLAFGMRAQTQAKWMEELGQSTEKDKAKHYWVSFGGTILISEVVYHYTKRPGLSPIIGGLAMFGVGLGKEYIWDGMMHKGVKSGGDVFMDGWGVISGMLGARVVIHIREQKRDKPYEY